MSEVSSFGLTEKELKEVILPNIYKIEDLIKTVDDLPALKPLECALEDMSLHLWNTYKIRIVNQGDLSESIQEVLNDKDTGKETSFCVLVELDRVKPAEHIIFPSLMKYYELMFIDAKRRQILSTRDVQEHLQPGYTWKEIILPIPGDSSHLGRSYIAAKVLSWAHRKYKNNHEWENILSRLHHLPILSSENTAKLVNYINNKQDLDEQKREEKEQKVCTITDHGIKNFRSLLSVREDVERQLGRKCEQAELNYIRDRYISGCIDNFLRESNQTLQSNFTNAEEDTERRFAELLISLKKVSKVAGI